MSVFSLLIDWEWVLS